MAAKPNFSHIKTHTVRGKRFRIVWRGGKAYHGWCDDPRVLRKRICVESNRDPVETLGTVIHESIHAAFFDLDEDAVTVTERDIVRLLRRMKIKVTFGEP